MTDWKKRTQNMTRNNFRAMLLSAFAFLIFSSTQAEEPIPEISALHIAPNSMELSFSNISTGGTYYIEHKEDLFEADWNVVDSFEGTPGTTNWIGTSGSTATSSFYRVVRDPYHEKVGEVATFISRAHGIAGTAHIVNNRTLELRNFFYDGQGITVKVYVFPTEEYIVSESIILGEEMVGPAFVDSTVTMNIPEGVDLNDFSYISIWCIQAGISFGDGQFQP